MWFLLWYLAGVVIVAAIFTIGIAMADGREAVFEPRVIGVIAITAICLGFVWPLPALSVLVSSILEQKARPH